MPDNPIHVDAEVMHGTPCFAGTRVPVANLFDLLSHGRSVDYFLEQFPTVRREHVSAVLGASGQKRTGDTAWVTTGGPEP